MLCKIIILSIIAISVDGIAPDQEQTYAVSSQSYHRGDVPLSYQFSAVHIYTTTEPTSVQQPYSHDQVDPRHSTIQYAPLTRKLPQNIQTRNIAPDVEYKKKIEEEKAEEFSSYQTKTDNIENELEPKNIQENTQNAHALLHRSYVPGNNIEVLPPHIVYNHDDVYHKQFQNQKVNIPKFIYKKIKEPYYETLFDSYNGAEQTYLSEDDNVLYRFLAKPNKEKQPYVLDPAFKPKLPLLHLNVARMYSVARPPHQAPQKPPTHTQAIFSPLRPANYYKTILYPVQNLHNNKPIHTPNINSKF